MQLDGVTLEQALNQIMTMNQLSYKVLSDRSIFVFPDTPPKHAQYDEQVVRTFYLSHADATELSQILSTIIRLPGIAVQPAIAPNKTANTITVRGTSSVVQILERIIAQNDKPRAEIVVDVEILEVDRTRTKSYGLNLSEYALGASVLAGGVARHDPDHRAAGDRGAGDAGGAGGDARRRHRRVDAAGRRWSSPPPFNLNTLSRGVSTADFYLAVPTAIVRFLESRHAAPSSSRSRSCAAPKARKLTLKLGQQIPVISTSYTPIATGGAGVNPLSSYQYKDVGVNIDMTPTVTLEGDILLDLTLDNSSRGADVSIGGVNVPSFVQRTVTTRLRLRDGESNLLAGLFQEQRTERRLRLPGRDPRAVPEAAVLGQHRAVRSDRHRDAADAAHRADARDHRSGSAADLHRLAAEPRRRRPAAADCGAARGAGACRGSGGRRACRRLPDTDASGSDRDGAAGAAAVEHGDGCRSAGNDADSGHGARADAAGAAAGAAARRRAASADAAAVTAGCTPPSARRRRRHAAADAAARGRHQPPAPHRRRPCRRRRRASGGRRCSSRRRARRSASAAGRTPCRCRSPARSGCRR